MLYIDTQYVSQFRFISVTLQNTLFPDVRQFKAQKKWFTPSALSLLPLVWALTMVKCRIIYNDNDNSIPILMPVVKKSKQNANNDVNKPAG